MLLIYLAFEICFNIYHLFFLIKFAQFGRNLNDRRNNKMMAQNTIISLYHITTRPYPLHPHRWRLQGCVCWVWCVCVCVCVCVLWCVCLCGVCVCVCVLWCVCVCVCVVCVVCVCVCVCVCVWCVCVCVWEREVIGCGFMHDDWQSSGYYTGYISVNSAYLSLLVVYLFVWQQSVYCGNLVGWHYY